VILPHAIRCNPVTAPVDCRVFGSNWLGPSQKHDGCWIYWLFPPDFESL
jgi:hypothetical protein